MLKVAVLGSGLVGSDLLVKVLRSKLKCVMFAGQREESPGIARAKELGVPTSIQGIEAIPKDCQIVFDCTTAKSHLANGAFFDYMDKFIIDLTPSRVGKMCVPVLNLKDCLKEHEVSLATCGAQAMAPIAKAIMDVSKPKYMELISTIASKSAGMGTRENIDEFTQTTAEALEELAGVPKAKAIILLNPAEPPIQMRNTLYTDVENSKAIRRSVNKMVKELKKYIPGYEVLTPPTFEIEENRLTTSITVYGQGDYLPKYAGNLDLITCVAVKVGEEYAK